MGEEIKQALGTEVQLIPGTGGVFTVTVGERLIFSKKEAKRFPTSEEIICQLQS